MNMARYILIFVAAAALVAGALFVLRPRPEVPVAVEPPTPDSAVVESAPASPEADEELLAEVDSLRRENAALEEKVVELQAALTQARPVNLELPEQWVQSLEGREGAELLEPAAPQPGEDEASREERREEWRTRRQEITAQMQARMTDFLAQQYDTAPDLATRQRMSDISTHLNAMNELRALLDKAETDEERAKLEEELQQTQDATRSLLREQQQEVMANAAENLGLTTEEEQQAYAESVRQVMQSPFTWAPMMGGGGGGFGRGSRDRDAQEGSPGTEGQP
jgi:hypothetical protein